MSNQDFFDEATKVGDDGEIAGGEDSQGEWWKPEEGDVLAGTLINGFYRTGYEGKGVDAVLVIRDRETDTLVNVGCSPKMLKDGVIEKAPPEGTLIVIQYAGTRTAKTSGHTFKKYIMTVEQEPDHGYWHAAYEAYMQKERMNAYENDAPGAAVPTFSGPEQAPF